MMLPIKYTSGDREVICPYDKTHVIVAKSFNAHLLKCRKNHRDMPMVVCRFDKNHLIPKPEKAYHESECPSQYLLDRERQKLAGDTGLRGNVKGPPIVADHNTAIDNEDWGACAPVRTPALFNKMEPSENFVGPYMPSGLPQGQGNLSDASHVRPHTSSMAAGLAPSAFKKKALPSSVFEYTSSYGRGRGKIMAPTKPTATSSVHPTTAPAPEKGQFEDITASYSEPDQRQLFAHNSNVTQAAPNLPSSFTAEKERKQQNHDQLQQLNLLHMEEQEKCFQEHQLQLVQLEKEFAEKKQKLLLRQEEQKRLLQERLLKLQQAISAAASSPSAHPPGFSPSGSSASTVADFDVLNKTTAIALQKEKNITSKEEESWHVEPQGGSGFSLFPPGTPGHAHERNLANSIGLNGSVNVNHVTNWLSNQHMDDIDDPGTLAAGAENPSESQKMKRKLEKKLRQINVLEQKVSLGHKLSKAEEDKLNQKADVISQLTALDCTIP